MALQVRENTSERKSVEATHRSSCLEDARAGTLLRVKLVGHSHHGSSPNNDAKSVKLETEPTNQYDPYAIRVLSGGKHVAYVERESALILSPVLDKLNGAVFNSDLLSAIYIDTEAMDKAMGITPE